MQEWNVKAHRGRNYYWYLLIDFRVCGLDLTTLALWRLPSKVNFVTLLVLRPSLDDFMRMFDEEDLTGLKPILSDGLL